VGGTAQTEGERSAQRQGQMNDSLGRFDEILRGEREQIARDRDAQARDSNAGGEGTGSETPSGGGTRDGDMKGDMDNAGSSAEEQREKDAPPGDMQSDSSSSNASNSGTGANTNKGKAITVDGKPVPNGKDDDTIARQIREAAEKETDPELKEKLWREYVEYKKNAK